MRMAVEAVAAAVEACAKFVSAKRPVKTPPPWPERHGIAAPTRCSAGAARSPRLRTADEGRSGPASRIRTTAATTVHGAHP